MTLEEALDLEPGDLIRFGRSVFDTKNEAGEVLKVTPRGVIRVQKWLVIVNEIPIPEGELWIPHAYAVSTGAKADYRLQRKQEVHARRLVSMEEADEWADGYISELMENDESFRRLMQG